MNSMPPPLHAWLTANGKGGLVDAGLQPLVTFTVAGGQGLPPMPDDVLGIWALTLATGRIMVLQSEMAFIRQCRRAGKSDEQICGALPLANDTSLDERLEQMRHEVENIQVGMADPKFGRTER